MVERFVCSIALAAGILNFAALPGFSQWANRDVCGWVDVATCKHNRVDPQTSHVEPKLNENKGSASTHII